MPTSDRRRTRLALVVSLLLAGCGRGGGEQTSERTAGVPDARRVECAQAGAQAFERVCTVDRLRGANGLMLTLSTPDGGFRRLLVTGDGRGLVSADGADPAIIRVIGSAMVEVTVGRDRYRLPAHLKGQARPRGA